MVADVDSHTEIWTPHGRPLEGSISDDSGYPLTWGRVRDAHAWLVFHASCGDTAGGSSALPYDSDDDDGGGPTAPCYCQWHPVAIEERSSHEWACAQWPGPYCSTCWRASCDCGYTFNDVADAPARWGNGRLQCSACHATPDGFNQSVDNSEFEAPAGA